MSDLISREETFTTLCEEYPLLQKKYLRRVIDKVPSADRPQGVWRAKSFHECFCNNCEFSFDIMKCDFLENMKFCPNCGAKMMRGKKNEVY